MKADCKAVPLALPAWKAVLENVCEAVNLTARQVAFATGTSERNLVKQLLLHLPRFSPAELGKPDCIRAEAERLADRWLRLQAPFAQWTEQPRITTFQKAEIRPATCDEEIARTIHERFHYLGLFREGYHMALFANGSAEIPMALATLSSMDISCLLPIYPTAAGRSRVRVVSRLFAFDWAPRNSVSYLLGQLSKWVRAQWPEVETLLTYVNPNLGFTGTSYEASNWGEFLEVPARYGYLDGDYISFRRLQRLSRSRRKDVTYSQYELAPLKIFHCRIRTRPQLHRGMVIPEVSHSSAEAR